MSSLKCETTVLTNDGRVLGRLVTGLSLQVLNLAHNALAVDDLAVDDVLLVQMWRGDGRDEELRSVGASLTSAIILRLFSRPSHSPGPAFAMLSKNGLSWIFSKFSSSNFSP
jgi:hypothetical protein